MAKVRASLADVETQFVPAPPDRYRLRILKMKETLKPSEPPGGPERQNFNYEIEISSGEHQGKKVFHNVALNKKDGSDNPAGQADQKRLYQGVLGIDPEDDSYDYDSLDTDQILNGEFEANLTISEYEGKKRNELDGYSIGPVK
jgi:hypothetical protein